MGIDPPGAAKDDAVIPAQRAPTHDSPPPASVAPVPVLSASLPPGSPKPRLARRVAASLALMGMLAAVVATVVETAPKSTGTFARAAAAAAPVIPLTPYEQATKSLDEQAAAIMRGDRAGWLAAVDPRKPALRKHYQDLYATLQALHVTHLEYRPGYVSATHGTVVVDSQMAYCLSADTCPPYVADSHAGPPRLAQRITLRLDGARFVITKLDDAYYPNDLQPMPWEAGDLVFAQGRRVTVGAPRSLAKQLPRVLAVADKAALVDDRFATYMDNPQQRYRIFLATDATWKNWYGGENASYSVAYTVSLNDAGSDVVLKMSQLAGDAQELKVVIQHEMAHVATLSNLTTSDQHDEWLMEGVADYIGWLPQHTRSDWNFPAIRVAFNGSHPPKSMVRAELPDNASARAVATYYGTGHFAVECLVTKYGEAKAMTFVRLKLRLGDSLDTAAAGAFGTRFAPVDKTCVAWMRQNAR